MVKKEKPKDAWGVEAQGLPYLKSLYSTAYRLTHNEDDAQDLVQETYLKAYKYYDKFKEGTNFKAWLFKILKNTFINNYRKKKTQPQKVDFAYVEESLESLIADEAQDKDTPETLFLDKLLDKNIKEALESLPEEYRIVVILCDIEDFSYKEISAILDIPIGTVMSRLYRGRKLLEKALLTYAREHGYLRDRKPHRLRSKDLLDKQE